MKLILNDEKEIALKNAYEYISENERWYFTLEFIGEWTQREIQEIFSEENIKKFQISDEANVLTYENYNELASARITLNSENLLENTIKINLTERKD